MDKEQYNKVQAIYQKLLNVPLNKRAQKLNDLTSDDEIKQEVLELLENTSDLTIISKNKHSKPLTVTPKRKVSKRWFSFVFSSTIVFRTTLVVALFILFILGFWTHNNVQNNLEELRISELNRTINSLGLSLDLWIKDYKHDVQNLCSDPELRKTIEQFLANTQDKAKLDAMLKKEIDLSRYAGYAVISKEAEVILTPDTTEDSFMLREQNRGTLAAVIEGETRFGPPLYSSGWGESSRQFLRKPNVWVSHSIKNDSGVVIAVLSVARPADDEFSQLFSTTRLGETGESYAVDKDGMMLTESRFKDDVLQLGLIDSSGKNNIRFFVKDPGVSLKSEQPTEQRSLWGLTKPAQAIQSYALEDIKASGVIEEVYRDYRGEDVIGAWMWFPEFRFGVITEMDASEAYSVLPYITISFVSLGVILGAFVILSLFSTLKIIRLSEKARQGKFGQYIIEKQIGEGGMSNVYLAGHELLQRPTALKVLKPEALNENSIKRFQAEAKQISRLRNPHTIELYDYGVTEKGTIYYAMEFLDGLTLKELVKLNGPLSVNRAVFILKKVCESLKEAHDLNLIHRDIKPQNVMVCVLGGLFDMVKVLDFGLVKDLEKTNSEELTTTSEITGTPLYMSPERITTPGSSDNRSDIYAVGALAYYILSAQPLFEYKNDLDVMYQIINTVPPSLKSMNKEVPDMLSNLVSVCLEKEKEDRPESVDFLMNILEQIAEEHPYTQEDAKKWWQRFKG